MQCWTDFWPTPTHAPGIATNLLQGSIDRWFSAPVETILRGGAEVTVELRELVEENLERQAEVAAEELRLNQGQTDFGSGPSCWQL